VVTVGTRGSIGGRCRDGAGIGVWGRLEGRRPGRRLCAGSAGYVLLDSLLLQRAVALLFFARPSRVSAVRTLWA